MTCEPHVRREVEAELAAERADVAYRDAAAAGGWDPPTVPDSPYPPAPPIVDADAGTVTVPLNLRGVR